MSHLRRRTTKSRRNFGLLVLIILIGGALLWSYDELINPLESTGLLLNMATNAEIETYTSPDVTAPDPIENSPAIPTTTMTMETFTAELEAAGVNVAEITATMSAGGRSLENLLAVVNSGRVTVAELAERLKNEATDETTPPAAENQVEAIHWDALGSVIYNLWFMGAVTLGVIVLARPFGWLVRQVQSAPARVTA